MTSEARLVLVLQHSLTAFGLQRLLEESRRFDVCVASAAAGEALATISSSAPDLAIVDLSLEDGVAAELVRQIRKRHPAVLILMLCPQQGPYCAELTERFGASGYFVSTDEPTRVLETIGIMLQGDAHRPPRDGSRLAPSLKKLTDRECEVFFLGGRGYRPRHIARRLNLSVKTVARHRENIRKKLGLESSSQVDRRAAQWVTGADVH